jgi:hypothetical protein
MSPLYVAPYFALEFHLRNAQIGTLASVLAITWAASTLIFGALSDRVGRKPVLVCRRLRLFDIVLDVRSSRQLSSIAVDSRAHGRGRGSHLVHHDRPDRGIVPAQKARAQYRICGQRGRLGGTGRSPRLNVPAQFRATSIGLVILVGEVIGATAAPILAGTLAEKYGLALTMWLAAGEARCYFLQLFFFARRHKSNPV